MLQPAASSTRPPVVIPTTPLVSPVTSKGVNRSVVEPSPSCPEAFSPQHFTPPDVVTAHECPPPAPKQAGAARVPPALIRLTPLERLATSTATSRSAVVPSPTSPLMFCPQHLAPPPAITAQLWVVPALIS